MSDKGRLLFWILFLAGAGVAAVLPEWFPSDGKVTVDAVTRGPHPMAHGTDPEPPAAESPDVAPRRVAMEGVGTVDLFATKRWMVPPAALPTTPPPPPPPPPQPSVPPLPFKFMGSFDDGTSRRVFLQRGEKAYVVSAGEVVDGTYRVESVKPGQITLIYLPFAIAQTLPAGSPQ